MKSEMQQILQTGRTADMSKILSKGVSLLEILVVVTVFAILGIIVTESIVLTLRGSKKSESQVKVRENLDYAVSVIERQLRNADSVSPCPNSDDTKRIDYKDNEGAAASFSCSDVGPESGSIASGSGVLTGSDVVITSCSFECKKALPGGQPSVEINITAKEAGTSGAETSQVSYSTQVFLRTY